MAKIGVIFAACQRLKTLGYAHVIKEGVLIVQVYPGKIVEKPVEEFEKMNQREALAWVNTLKSM